MTPVERPGLPRRAVLRLALGAGGAGALSACGLSVDDTVRPGLEVDAAQDREEIQYQPEPPRAGMTPAELVQGFLLAGASTGSGLSVARSYLTPEASSAWNPDDAQTIVQAQDLPQIRSEGDGTMHVQTRVAARIDADGRYSLAKASDGAIVRFGVSRVDGEWRISKVQQDFGRLLPSSRVDQMYRRYRVHYAAIGWNRLVPDLRWIPSDQEATRLVRAQLGDVPGYLAGAVQTDADARLTVDAVPVIDGVAQVDLKTDLSSDPTVRKNFAAQLVASLMQLPAVTQVALSVAGSTLDLPGIEPPLTSPAQFGFVEVGSPDGQYAIVREDERAVPVPLRQVGAATDTDVAARESPFLDVPTRWARLAVSLDGKEIAGVRGSGLELVRWFDDKTSMPVEQFATHMTRPVYDASGVLWVAGRGELDSSRLWVINTAVDPSEPDAEPAEVPAPWLTGRRPIAISVSPDSTCLAAISTDDGGGDVQIQVSGIARQPNGLPTSTATQSLQVAASVEQARDLTWITPTTLGVLGRRSTDKAVRPLLVEVGGQIEALAAVTSARSIATTGGERELYVTTSSGRTYSRVGASWSALGVTGTVVVPSS